MIAKDMDLFTTKTKFLIEFLLRKGYKKMLQSMFKEHRHHFNKVKITHIAPLDKFHTWVINQVADREDAYKYLYNLLIDRGLFSGQATRELFRKLLDDKPQGKAFNTSGVVTFRDLYEATQIKFVVTGTNLTKKAVRYFSVDYTPDFPVIE